MQHVTVQLIHIFITNHVVQKRLSIIAPGALSDEDGDDDESSFLCIPHCESSYSKAAPNNVWHDMVLVLIV